MQNLPCEFPPFFLAYSLLSEGPHYLPSFLPYYFSSMMTKQSMYSSFHSINTKSIDVLLWARQLLGVKQ